MIAGRSRSPNRTGVALFDDYAVVDRQSQSFFIGSLSRMVHAGSHGRQEYKRPVAYDDPKRESITCYFQVCLCPRMDPFVCLTKSSRKQKVV